DAGEDGAQENIGQCFAAVGRVSAGSEEAGADRDGVDVGSEVLVVAPVSDVPGGDHSGSAQAVLNLKAGIVHAVPGNVLVELPAVSRAYGAEHQIAAGGSDLREGRVIDLRSVAVRRLARHVIHLVAVEPVVEDAEAAADGGLTIAGEIVGEPDARGKS